MLFTQPPNRKITVSGFIMRRHALQRIKKALPIKSEALNMEGCKRAQVLSKIKSLTYLSRIAAGWN